MSEPIAGQSPERRNADGPYGRALLAVSQGFAIAGGLVFVGLVVMSIVSIVGRKLASSPVPGDVEVLQMCAAFAAASFFAYCHLIGGDVKVDFFTANARARTIHWLDTFGSLLVGLGRRAAGLAHLCRRDGGQGSRREQHDPRLAPVDTADGHGAGLRAAGAGRLLQDGAAPARGAVRGPGMSGIAAGSVIFALLMVLLVIRVPIGIAMFTMGSLGFWYLNGMNLSAVLSAYKTVGYARLSNYDLVVIPLFLLMGQFATQGGLSAALFRFVAAFMGHLRGGIAMASIGACAGFGAICGSSLATAATMGQVALPELKRFGYSGSLSTGALAAGGTLGIMIPPSVPLVIYAILTQESIGKLFMAAVLPGVIAMLGYMIVIRIVVMIKPAAGPAGPLVPWADRLKALAQVTPVLGVFLVVIVGIYGGWANPTEAAAIGAAACGVLAITTGGMRAKGVKASCWERRRPPR